MPFLKFLTLNARWLSAGAVLTLLSSFGQTFFISIFAGEIRGQFDLSHGAWGGIYALGTTASAVVMVWAGGLTDVLRVRILGPVVLCGLAGACLAMAFNPYLWALPFIVFALRFFGQSMASHLAVVAMARWFVATRGRALSVASLGFAFGEATLPIVFVSLMAVMDWHLLWVAATVISLCGIPVLVRLLSQERTPQSIAQSADRLGMHGRNWTRSQVLCHPLFWFMIPALLGPAAFNTAFFFHQVRFSEIKGWSHIQLVSLFPLYTATAVIAMFASGWALDRIGTARLMPFIQVPMAISFLLFSYASGSGILSLGLILLAVTTGANATLPNAFWAEFYGTAHIGTIKALAAAVMVLGSALGPGLTGLLMDVGIGLERQFITIATYFIGTTALMVIGIGRAKSSLPA